MQTPKNSFVNMKSFLVRLLLKKYKPYLVVIFGGHGHEEAREAVNTVLSRHTHTFASIAPDFFDNLYRDRGGFLKVVRALFFHKPFPHICITDALPKEGGYQLLKEALGVDLAIIIPFTETSYEDSEGMPNQILKEIRGAKFLVLNYDDESVRSFADAVDVPRRFYGFEEGADIQIIDFVEQLYIRQGVEGGLHVRVTYNQEEIAFGLADAYGIRHLYAACCALGAAIYYDVPLKDAVADLKIYTSPGEALTLRAGVKNTALLTHVRDVTPLSAREAIEILGSMRKDSKIRRSVIILGDILWGDNEQAEGLHQTLGELAAHNANLLFLAGERVIFAEQAALEHGMLRSNIYRFDTVKEAARVAQDHITKHDGILILGSVQMHMERAVEELEEI